MFFNQDKNTVQEYITVNDKSLTEKVNMLNSTPYSILLNSGTKNVSKIYRYKKIEAGKMKEKCHS